MLRNFITVALRHLFRHKLFSLINVLCLAIGLTCTLTIGIYVWKQYSTNTNLRHLSRQYMLKSNWKVKEMGLDLTTLAPLAKTLREEYPLIVANYFRYNPVTNVVSAGDKHFREDIAIGDTTFISMYGFPLLYGNAQKPFPDNDAAVITESLARKLFGNENAIGKTISIETTVGAHKQDYHVTAVLKDIPYNSVTHLLDATYSVYVPTIGNRYYQGGDPAVSWQAIFEISMVELQPGKTPADLEGPLKAILKKYTTEDVQKNLAVELAPIRHYYWNDHNGAVRRMCGALSLAAIFILLMALINFVNISMGTSAYRIKEIGLRKVFGGVRKQIILQFLTEALLLTIVAAILSLTAYELLRPLFGQVLNTTLVSLFHFNLSIVLYLVGLVLLTALLAGIYPAFILSSSRVVLAVKGKIDSARGGLFLRKAMLTVQFTLAIMVFISALTISRQVSYIFNKDIGYNKEQVLVITAFPKQWDSAGIIRMMGIRDALQQVPVVKDVSISFEIPDSKPSNSIDMEPVGVSGKKALITSCGTDEHYAATFGLKLLNGSFFNRDNSYIPNQLVLNESAVKALGLTPASAVNVQIRSTLSPQPFTVAGVIKDFHYSNMQEKIGPLAFFHVRDAQAYRYLSLKLNTDNISQSLSLVQSKWKEISPNAPFEYTFMDDKFASLYRQELQLKKAADMATALNLVIVFLGIFGVVSFTLAKRTREIAVRKVLGASIRSLVVLFAREYALLMVLANLVAWPLTYWFTSSWLQGYAYRVTPGIMPYLVVGLSLFAGSLVLIALQCRKAGMVSPVKSLQAE